MKKKDIIELGKSFSLRIKIIELIILKTTDLSKNQLFLLDEIDDQYISQIKKYFVDISRGYPIEYLIGKANFYSLDFFVNDNVLIPRDDTEIMVDNAIEHINKLNSNYFMIDIGTGSSCIPISILKNVNKLPDKCYALDISQSVLEVANFNINKFKLNNLVKTKKSDLLDYFLDNNYNFLNKSNIVITANLPYIKNNDFSNMDNETIKYEPDLALYGGELTGFELYEKLFSQILLIKNKYSILSIILFIEIGFDQKQISENYFKSNGYKYEYFKDNSGIERCIKISI